MFSQAQPTTKERKVQPMLLVTVLSAEPARVLRDGNGKASSAIEKDSNREAVVTVDGTS